MCLAMWLGFGPRLDLEESNNYNYVSAASIYKLRRVSKNINAKKNDFSSQECVIRWELCNSTSKGFSNLNGFQFLRHFIKNIQIDEITFSTLEQYFKKI